MRGGDDEATAVLDYLEHLVVTAIATKRPPTTDVAGRVVAVLLEALTSAGGADRALGYLAPEPGGSCRLEAVVDGRRDAVDDDAVFSRFGDDTPPGAAVEAVGPGGLRRRALEVADDGATVFVFPDGTGAVDGPGAGAAQARWAWVLATWGRAPVAADALTPPTPVDPAPAARAVDDPAPAAAPAGGPPPPSADPTVVADAVRTALSEVALEVDLGAIDVAVADAVRRAVTDALPSAGVPATTTAAPVNLDVDRLADLLADRLPAPGVDDEALGALTDALGGGAAVSLATLESLREQLHLQLQGFGDRVTAGTRALVAAAEQVAERARRDDEAAERSAEAVAAAIDRLGRQLDRRLNELQTASTPRPRRSTQAAADGGGTAG